MSMREESCLREVDLLLFIQNKTTEALGKEHMTKGKTNAIRMVVATGQASKCATWSARVMMQAAVDRS